MRRKKHLSVPQPPAWPRRWFLFAWIAALMFFPHASPADQGPEPPPDPGSSATILSASEYDYPPFCIVTADGQADGFSVELLRAALEAMGREVSFDVGPWEEVKRSLVEGQVQVLPLVGRTPERERIFDFTFPYLTMHGTIVVREGETGIRSLADLAGRQVGVMQGDNAEEFLRRNHPEVGVATTATFEEALRGLAAGRHDAVVIQKLVALQLMKQMGMTGLKTVGPPLQEFVQPLCFAVREGDKDLLSLLNEGLSLVIADGTFRRLHTKWFAPIEDPSRRRARIIVGGDNDYPPFEFLDENGEPAGYNVELTRAIARQMGLEVTIRLGPWAEIREGLAANEVDAVQGMFYSAERERYFDFSPAHAVVNHTFVVRSGTRIPQSMAELSGLSLLVMKGDIMHDVAVKQGYADQLTPVATQEEALRLLAQGRYDCALVAKIPALYWIKKHGWVNLRVAEQSIQSPEYCYAVPHNHDWLLSRFSEGLANIKATGEYRQIYSRWLGPYEKDDPELREILQPLLWFAVPTLLLLAATLLWSRTLRQRVQERTAELHLEIAERRQSEIELEQARAAAETASRAKSEFLANMSHEIRTPLNGLFGMLQHVQTTPLNAEQAECIDIALGSGQKLLGVLNDILDLSRIEAGKMELDRGQFSPAQTVGEVVGIFKANAQAKKIALHCRVAPELATMVVGDEGRLRQVLFNLVGNAVKFTERGQVTIDAEIQPAGKDPGKLILKFTVSDSGIGIPRDQLAGIFEPFTQVDGTHTRKYGGSGLGLSIVRRLVDLMGGEVAIESEPGAGTNIRFSIVVGRATDQAQATDRARAEEEDASASPPLPTRTLRVLIAEDDRINRLVMERLLGRQGHEVTAVADGEHCLQALDEERFDLVFMDIQMPDMDGIEATRRIRDRDDEKKNIPIVALTAHAMNGDREKFIAEGMDDYLSKPVDPGALRALLGRLFSASEKDDPGAA